MQIGFVGLGAMGLPMSRRLVEAGHTVKVASRSRPPVETALSFGAFDARDSAGAAEASEVVILCVPSSSDVAGIVDSMLGALGPGKIVVDCSTIDPDVERAQHEKVASTGAAYLDAPVSGGPPGARSGTLTVMVGGDSGTLEAAAEPLTAFAGRIVHVGGPGMGQVVKLCNNMIFASQMAATAEAAAMALRSGADPTKLHEVLVHSSADCTAVRTRFPVPGVVRDSPATKAWQPGFATDLMAKDLDLALSYGARAGVAMSTTAGTRQLLTATSRAGYGREDFSALAKVVFALAGLPWAPTGGPPGAPGSAC
ncbi:MAG TPA: NAD(P)-dependent oxidoreductase [Acidimicrobiales bacterium]|nr:NAD(P)-dependent oxidoreductase [Acidimicrobiales bacterium]